MQAEIRLPYTGWGVSKTMEGDDASSGVGSLRDSELDGADLAAPPAGGEGCLEIDLCAGALSDLHHRF